VLAQHGEPFADGAAVGEDKVPERGAAVGVRFQQSRRLGDAAVVKEPGDGVNDVTAAGEVLRRTAARVDWPAQPLQQRLM
jgi:hypothetical protein